MSNPSVPPESRKRIPSCSDCDNSKILRAAAFRLAKEITDAYAPNISLASTKVMAHRIEGFAKHYGNRRVARFKEENEL